MTRWLCRGAAEVLMFLHGAYAAAVTLGSVLGWMVPRLGSVPILGVPFLRVLSGMAILVLAGAAAARGGCWASDLESWLRWQSGQRVRVRAMTYRLTVFFSFGAWHPTERQQTMILAVLCYLWLGQIFRALLNM